jgi:glutamate-5-semialdehyde dehydrogenase
VLVHKEALETTLPVVAQELLRHNVHLRLDELSYSCLVKVLGEHANFQLAQPQDFRTEFLDLVIAVKTVESLEEAIGDINKFGSHHTDCIVTENERNADLFMKRVDSAGVYWNASTRFADGFRYGFGAEIGVSTNKTHARGPVGLEGLMIYKYRLYGKGQGAGDYGSGNKSYQHHPLPLEYGQQRISK